MTVVLDVEHEEVISSNVVGWHRALYAEGKLNEANYKIWIQCEIAGSATNRPAALRVLLDGNVVDDIAFLPSIVDVFDVRCFFGRPHLTEGTHSLELQYGVNSSSQTVSVRHRRALAEQD